MLGQLEFIAVWEVVVIPFVFVDRLGSMSGVSRGDVECSGRWGFCGSAGDHGRCDTTGSMFLGDAKDLVVGVNTITVHKENRDGPLHRKCSYTRSWSGGYSIPSDYCWYRTSRRRNRTCRATWRYRHRDSPHSKFLDRGPFLESSCCRMRRYRDSNSRVENWQSRLSGWKKKW